MNIESFMALFKEKYFLPNLRGKKKNEILKELLQPLKENGLVKNHDMLLETLKKRETLGSTGMGKKVAIPHCRSLTVSELIVVVGLSHDGVEWESMDKKPVHLFFLIVAPPQERQNIYLPVLGKICEMIRDNKIRKNFLKVSCYEEFINILRDSV